MYSSEDDRWHYSLDEDYDEVDSIVDIEAEDQAHLRNLMLRDWVVCLTETDEDREPSFLPDHFYTSEVSDQTEYDVREEVWSVSFYTNFPNDMRSPDLVLYTYVSTVVPDEQILYRETKLSLRSEISEAEYQHIRRLALDAASTRLGRPIPGRKCAEAD